MIFFDQNLYGKLTFFVNFHEICSFISAPAPKVLPLEDNARFLQQFLSVSGWVERFPCFPPPTPLNLLLKYEHAILAKIILFCYLKIIHSWSSFCKLFASLGGKWIANFLHIFLCDSVFLLVLSLIMLYSLCTDGFFMSLIYWFLGPQRATYKRSKSH